MVHPTTTTTPSPERKEDVTYAGNYLVFGHGPHYCVGKEYANNHLIAFLAILSTSLDWARFRLVAGGLWVWVWVSGQRRCWCFARGTHLMVVAWQSVAWQRAT